MDVVVADLDGTLCVSGSPHASGERVVVDRWPGGSSVTTAAGSAAWAAMAGADQLVPATARRVDQVLRMHWPGGLPRFVIALNGAVILKDGQPVDAWRAEVASIVARLEWDRSRAEELIVRYLGPSARVTPTEGHFAHAICGGPIEEQAVDLLRWRAETAGCRVSVQGRKVYVGPVGAGKQQAVEWLAGAQGLRVVAAAGDSLLDAPMMVAAGRSACPLDSEVHRCGAVPGAHVVVGSDVVRVGRIAQWLADTLWDRSGSHSVRPA